MEPSRHLLSHPFLLSCDTRSLFTSLLLSQGSEGCLASNPISVEAKSRMGGSEETKTLSTNFWQEVGPGPRGSNYTEQQKQFALKEWARYQRQYPTRKLRQFVAELCFHHHSFSFLSGSTMRSWIGPKAPKEEHSRKGRPCAPMEFEEAVMSSLLYDETEELTNAKDFISAAPLRLSFMNSYAVIRNACERLQKQEPWKNDLRVVPLKFSDKYVQNFISRNSLRKTKATTVQKNRPTVEAVRTRMGQIVRAVLENKIPTENIMSWDETALLLNLTSTHQYAPAQWRRATALAADLKARITGHLGVDGAGNMCPPFFIIRHFSKTDDATKTRAVKTVKTDPQFATEKGWSELKVTADLMGVSLHLLFQS